jgi:hypothetical protein
MAPCSEEKTGQGFHLAGAQETLKGQFNEGPFANSLRRSSASRSSRARRSHISASRRRSSPPTAATLHRADERYLEHHLKWRDQDGRPMGPYFGSAPSDQDAGALKHHLADDRGGPRRSDSIGVVIQKGSERHWVWENVLFSQQRFTCSMTLCLP